MYENLTEKELEKELDKYRKNKVAWYFATITCTAGAVLALYLTKDSPFDGSYIGFPLLAGGLVAKTMTGVQFRKQREVEYQIEGQKEKASTLEKIIEQ